MDRDSHLITEAYDGINEGEGAVKQFIDFYKRRSEELQTAAGHDGSATGEFMFDIGDNGKLHIGCDVCHADTILGSLSPEVVGKTPEEQNAFIQKFHMGNYIETVLKALHEVGVKGVLGLDSRPGVARLGREGGLGTVSVNSYTGDTLTVQLDVPNFVQNFPQHKHQYAVVVDTFIAQMFKTIKLLDTKYFKPQPFTPPEA